MTIKFETYDKRYYPTSSKVLISLIVLFTITWIILLFLNFKPKFDYLKFYALIFFILSIIACFTYKVISWKIKKFIPTGTIEFMNYGVSINSNNSTCLIRKEDIIKLSLFMDSYDGQAEPNFGVKGNVSLDGLENRFFIQAKDINRSYKFYINNRGQIIVLRKLLNSWIDNSNINIRFTDKHAKDCLKNIV